MRRRVAHAALRRRAGATACDLHRPRRLRLVPLRPSSSAAAHAPRPATQPHRTEHCMVFIGSLPLRLPVRSRPWRSRTRAAPVDSGRRCRPARRAAAARRCSSAACTWYWLVFDAQLLARRALRHARRRASSAALLGQRAEAAVDLDDGAILGVAHAEPRLLDGVASSPPARAAAAPVERLPLHLHADRRQVAAAARRC